MSNNSPEKSQTISAIINRLKTAFRDTDYKDAEQLLLSREHLLNQRLFDSTAKNNLLLSELSKLKLHHIARDNERSRFSRELGVKEEQLSDLAHDLGVSRDAEAKALKRYDKALELVRKLEEEKEELISKFRDDYEELEGRLRRRNEVLEEKKVEFEEEVRELKVRLSEKEAEIVSFSIEKGEVEELRRRIADLEGEKAELDDEIEELRKRNESLGGEKAELSGEVEELRRRLSEEEKCVRVSSQKREIESLMRGIKVWKEEKAEIGKRMEEKEGEVKELMKKVEELGREKREDLMERIEALEKEINEIAVEKDRKISGLEKEKFEQASLLKRIDESFQKLQGDVVSAICLDVKKGGKLANSRIGKILEGVLSQLDAEESGDGVLKKDSDFDSLVKDPKSLLKSAIKSEEATMRPSVPTELSAEDGANHSKKTPCLPDSIEIISDDENDGTPPRQSGLKRKIDFSGSLIEIHDDASNDGSLNQSHQTKNLKEEQDETPKRGQSVAASVNDHKFITPERKSLADIRKFAETGSSKLKGRESGYFSAGDKSFLRRSKTSTFLSPQLKEYMIKCQEKLQKRSLDCVADMIWACEKDPTFCCKAVCALYRQHNSHMTSGSKIFRDSDIDRGTTLAKFLIDGDKKFDMKKSADELNHHDPKGLDDCRRLASQYSKELFEIFKNNIDPLFSCDN